MDQDSRHVTARDEPDGLIGWAEIMAHRPVREHYGPWKFDQRLLTICFEGYEIDLEQITTSAEALDWIMQINGKDWAGPLVMAWLVEALDDLLHPQSTLCSFGAEQGPIDPAAVIAKRIAS